jgi:hypothetical protein
MAVAGHDDVRCLPFRQGLALPHRKASFFEERAKRPSAHRILQDLPPGFTLVCLHRS